MKFFLYAQTPLGLCHAKARTRACACQIVTDLEIKGARYG